MLDIQGRKYAAVTVCDVTLYDINTKYPVMYFDTLQLNSIEGANEVTEITGGKGNPILASISHTKNVDVQFDDAIMTMSSLALLTGGQLSSTRDPHNTVTITMAQTEIVEIKDLNKKDIIKKFLDESHTLKGWETDLSSQTGASQAGILHGNNKNIVAYRWVEKENNK